jgi:hypothetical protein
LNPDWTEWLIENANQDDCLMTRLFDRPDCQTLL